MDLLNQITSRHTPINLADNAGDTGVWSQSGDLPADLVFARFYSEQIASSVKSGHQVFAQGEADKLPAVSMTELAKFFNSDSLGSALTSDELSDKFSAWLSSVGLASDGFRFSKSALLSDTSEQALNVVPHSASALPLAAGTPVVSEGIQPGLLISSVEPVLQDSVLGSDSDIEALEQKVKPDLALAIDLEASDAVMPLTPLGLQSVLEGETEGVTLSEPSIVKQIDEFNVIQADIPPESSLLFAAAIQPETIQNQMIQSSAFSPVAAGVISALQANSGLSPSWVQIANGLTGQAPVGTQAIGLPLQNASALSDGFIAQALQSVAVRGGVNAQTLSLAATAQTLLHQSSIKQQVIQTQTNLLVEEAEIKKAQTADTNALNESVTKGARLSSPNLASIHYPLNHQKWNEALGKRMVFMANQSIQQAQISLNPEKLGPIQLRLQLDRDQMMTVSMSAHHATTREALEAAIPRLKEMLAEAGIMFDQIEVQEKSVFDQSGNQGSNPESDNQADDEVLEDELSVTQTDSDNLIDFYA